MERRATGLFLLTFVWALPASAQVNWYVGVGFGGGVKTLDFTVVDSSLNPELGTGHGRVSPRFDIGVHGGAERRIGKRAVVGGEFGFGRLGYRGEAPYGHANDSLGTTRGGSYWNAMVWAGYRERQVVLYGGLGVISSRNIAGVVDTCDMLPCGTWVGEGSSTTTAMRRTLAVGAQFDLANRIAERQWAIRLEWLQLETRPVSNEFARTVRGAGIPSGTTVPVVVNTNIPHGTLRVLLNVKLNN